MNLPHSFIYEALVFLAGFVDSIAGGGGLITVPALTLILGPGAEVIGTNKILAFTAAFTALLVYLRKGHFNFKQSLPFLMGIGSGALLGARAGILVPPFVFKWLLLIACPTLLILLLTKNALLADREKPSKKAAPWFIFLLGFGCGFYDGIFGPGGGTFMFLALCLLGGFSLLGALTTTKVANSISAGVSLASYSFYGVVHWSLGLKLAGFILFGALIGSKLASEKSQIIVKPILVSVVLLLFFRVLWM